MAGAGARLDALAEVRADGQIVAHRILPAVVVGLEIREPLSIKNEDEKNKTKQNDEANNSKELSSGLAEKMALFSLLACPFSLKCSWQR